MKTKTATKCIVFGQVTPTTPKRQEIKSGVVARETITGRWVPITTTVRFVDPDIYDTYTMASAMPSFGKFSYYPSKYNDLVEAKEVLKADRYGYDCHRTIGKAIGLIKRFLKEHAED